MAAKNYSSVGLTSSPLMKEGCFGQRNCNFAEHEFVRAESQNSCELLRVLVSGGKSSFYLSQTYVFFLLVIQSHREVFNSLCTLYPGSYVSWYSIGGNGEASTCLQQIVQMFYQLVTSGCCSM